MKFRHILSICILSFALLSCSFSSIKNDENKSEESGQTEVTYSLNLLQSSVELDVDDTYQLSYRVNPKNTKVAFKSDDPTIAKIDTNGLIKAVKKGTTFVTAYVVEKPSVKSSMTVKVYEKESSSSGGSEIEYSIKLTTSSVTLNVNETFQISYTAKPSNATVIFMSSDTSIATCSYTGLVTAKGKGKCTINASIKEKEGVSASFSVIVNEKEEEQGGQDIPPVIEDDYSLQDEMILHCFDWKMSNIKNKLDEIKNAGYSVIQLSPMQPQKDPYNGNWKDQWWKLYQPFGLSVAKSGQNILGNKQDIISLCSAAEEKGIKVIVDVVSNHLAGGNDKSLNYSVKSFEPEIYNNNLIHTLGKGVSDSNTQSIVQGAIGDFPDLKTENPVVQERVLSLLKEYIDCGIDGFRFDAAKHIETPSDGIYASNYWPTILDGANEYASSKGLDKPYYYGEILNTPGDYRKFTYYTEMMSTLDSNQGKNVLNGVVNGNLSLIKEKYNSGLDASKLVLWAESHDTYSNNEKETTNISIENINKAYVIQGSRKDASVLYFARPNASSNLGDIGTTNYKDKEVVAINKFHKMFKGVSENISSNNDCFVNVRGSKGAVIVSMKKVSTATITVEGLKDGTYTDLVSGNSFAVSNNSVNIKFTNGVCILVSDNMDDTTLTPSIELGTYQEVYSNSQTISIVAKNATEVAYIVNNGDKKILENNQIVLSSSIPNGVVNLKIIASNQSENAYKNIVLIKTDLLVNKDVLITGIETGYSYVAWLWSNDDGKWENVSIEGDILGLDMGTNNKFIIVKFPLNTTKENASWDNKIAQSIDVDYVKRVYSFSEIGL